MGYKLSETDMKNLIMKIKERRIIARKLCNTSKAQKRAQETYYNIMGRLYLLNKDE